MLFKELDVIITGSKNVPFKVAQPIMNLVTLKNIA
jgi:hypothetical protein